MDDGGDIGTSTQWKSKVGSSSQETCSGVLHSVLILNDITIAQATFGYLALQMNTLVKLMG
jgi:hypothetical protein